MKLLSFDTETTSAEPRTCRVVQVAAILFDVENGSKTAIVNEITDPGLESSEEATAIHGIGPEHWAGKRPDHEAMRELYAALELEGKEWVVCGHNVKWFDLPVLWRVADRAPLDLQVIDTMVCARRLYPLAPSHRLTTSPKEPHKTGLVEWLELGEVENAHSAEGDAIMVQRLVNHFSDLLAMTYEELAKWCSLPRVHKYASFGKHKGKRWGRDPGCVPFTYAKFIANNFSPDPDLAATLSYHYNLKFKGK